MHYTIGLDFGTLSVRAVVIYRENGEEAGTGTAEYAHGVITERLPTGEPLLLSWALHNYFGHHENDVMKRLLRLKERNRI